MIMSHGLGISYPHAHDDWSDGLRYRLVYRSVESTHVENDSLGSSLAGWLDGFGDVSGWWGCVGNGEVSSNTYDVVSSGSYGCDDDDEGPSKRLVVGRHRRPRSPATSTPNPCHRPRHKHGHTTVMC
jgi:hypothetical protein